MLVAYARIPSFVVTLGGLLFFRNAAYQLNDGKTVAPLDETFQLLGGGLHGTIGAFWSWAAGLLAVAAIAWAAAATRRRRLQFGFDVRTPLAGAAQVVGWSAAALGFVAVMNAYKRPGTGEAMGIAIPVLILGGVTLLMTILARRHRFGRHVYAVGGNPESAELAGIDIRRVTVKIFAVMGLLCGLASIVITARLNAGATATGTMTELNVIAATVIGGTSLAGGSGTIYGAVARCRRDAEPRERDDPDGRPLALAEDGAGGRADPRGLARHGLAPAAATVSAGPAAPLVEMRGISKTFGGVHAVEDVSVELAAGEVLGLLGHNGAGKSTLVKILSGVLAADAGEIRLDGRPVEIRSPRDAKALGIETIYQSLALTDNLDATANLFLGRELTGRLGFLREEAMEHAARGTLGRMRLQLPSLQAAVSSLSGGQRQAVAIARAVHFNARVLIMDEPTAALGPEETRKVGALIRELARQGIGIVLISHDIHDVFDLADRLTVMKNGRLVGTCRTAEVSKDEVLGMIIAGELPRALLAGGGRAMH